MLLLILQSTVIGFHINKQLYNNFLGTFISETKSIENKRKQIMMKYKYILFFFIRFSRPTHTYLYTGW